MKTINIEYIIGLLVSILIFSCSGILAKTNVYTRDVYNSNNTSLDTILSSTLTTDNVYNKAESDERYIVDAPADGNQYARQNNTWTTITDGVGGTIYQYYRGDKTWQNLTKSSVGLSNVTDTSDADKPVSTAQQNALNLKADLTNATFSGTVSANSFSGNGAGLTNVPSTLTSGADIDINSGMIDIQNQLDNVSTINRSSSNLTLKTTTSGNIIISPAENVGIGTSNPTTKLQVAGTITATAFEGNGAALTGIVSGFADPMTTRGDLIYRNSSNATTRLPIGGNGTVLKSNGTDISWGTAPSSAAAPQHIRIGQPAFEYANSSYIFLSGNVGTAFSVASVNVQLNADPSTEIDADLMYADSCVGFANAVVINALDTTAGTLYDNSITSASVPANKCYYIRLNASPDTSTSQMIVDVGIS